MKWVLIVFGGLAVLGGVAAGAWFLGRTAGGGGGEAAPAEASAPATAGEQTPAAAAAAAGVEAVTEPAPPRRVEDALKPANWPTFSIELGTFRSLDNAREYQEAMQSRDLATEVVEIVDVSGNSWYHVRMGRFDDPRQAAARLRDVEIKAGLYGVVVTEVRPVSAE
ncbi:SPOR domain-containing protein [Caenispirillum bisanense]|uniref:SPOR domain-containing protein n=1 Tax=Caenispirillum bisanense TaxID=414052 RepID=UPI0031D93050